MSDDTAKELAAYLAYAKAVVAALPVDPEADRIVTELLSRRGQGRPSTKIPLKRRT